ncbi:MAG: ATP-binding cassette domain-containing protein [Deltaproteobacteria bacterium]|nr:ATP-binding cassette domain-containing protein [Deltaproteobacteria bacterium]NIS78181.1 ATP-binding cassette domain-containing protein [Deltaproteobacteria bacterium]
MSKVPLLSVRNLEKRFRKGKAELQILKGVSIDVERSEKVGIVGVSGAGKTTFLQIIGTLDKPTGGEVFFDGLDVFSLSPPELALFRRNNVGFVFQSYNLLPEFNAVENVMLPLMIGGFSRKDAHEKAAHFLTRVGLKERLLHRVGELSGGEQQRVAISRAIALGPNLILADEPTGNLDKKTGEMVIDLLKEVVSNEGATLIMVTHNEQLIENFDRQLKIDDGRVMGDRKN